MLSFRQKLLQSQGCGFQGQVTADFGDRLYECALDYQADSLGNVTFSVTQPQTIAGITGALSEDGGELTFDDIALHFPLLAEEMLSPVSAGWVLVKALRGGNIQAVCMEEDLLHLSVDDDYEEDALRLDVWLNQQEQPVRAEILYEGRRILSLTISNFTLL